MIKCKKCGADIPDEMNYCGTCGAFVEQAVIPGEEAVSSSNPGRAKRPAGLRNLYRFVKPAMMIIAVIIVGLIIWSVIKPSKYEKAKGVVSFSQVDETLVIKPSGESITKIEGRIVKHYINYDGTITAFLVNENLPIGFNSTDIDGYSLYIVTDKPKLISDGVGSAVLSISGDSVAFTKDYDKKSGTEELCLWNGDKITTISSDFSPENSYVLSPDGKNVGFTITDDDETTGYYYNGKHQELGDDIQPVGIANDAKYIYYNKNGSFYVQKSNNSDTKVKLGERTGDYYFNKNMSQVVYSYNGKSYISRNGGEKNSLSDLVQNFLIPVGTAVCNNVIGVSSFADTFFYSEDKAIIRINGKFETHSIAKNVSHAMIANNGKTIIYDKNKSVYMVNGLKENAENLELVDGDVIDFISTADGSSIYYMTDDDELYYKKGSGKPVAVGEDLSGGERYGSYWSLFKGNMLFYISDNELYYSTGNRGKAVSSVDGDVRHIDAGLFDIFVLSSDDDEILTYCSADGKTFLPLE